MFKLRSLTSIVLVSWLFLGCAGQAAQVYSQPLQSRLESFWKLDRNGDGQVSRAEFRRWKNSARNLDLFAEIDINDDGLVSQKEFALWRGGVTESMPARKNLEPCLQGKNCTGIHRDIPYKTLAGVDPGLLSLDIYETNNDRAPIMIWVHGGGWTGGDKATQNGLGFKPKYFTDQGFLFVSVNYRLTPRTMDSSSSSTGKVMYPLHNQDVAAAVGWIKSHARDFGGNPDKISLIGHSAGGGIVSILGTDESFLADEDLPLSALQCVISLDIGGAYDLTQSAHNSRLFQHVFGDNPDIWLKASPVHHVKSAKSIPAFFIMSGKDRRQDRAARLSHEFAQALEQSGVKTELVIVEGMEHKAINQAIGNPEDTLIMPRLSGFIDYCR